jgi:tripartite-type tricarboxylate transporter receptor subunit TctC
MDDCRVVSQRGYHAVSMGRIALALALVAAIAPFGAGAQSASEYPSRTVRIVVPYAPGGVTDIIARHLAPKLQEALGQAFVVENKPGASGNIALEFTAAATPTAIRSSWATSPPTRSTRTPSPTSCR